MHRPYALASFALLVACSRGGAKDGTLDGGASVAAAPAETIVTVPKGATAIFSAPIAGARVAVGEAIAVGLVVANKTITAARVDGTGHAAWTHPVFTNVTWSQDAELHAWPIASGAVVVWRGPVAGKSAHQAAVVGADGRIVDGPFDVGSFVCATDDGVAWSEPGAKGTRVKLRVWSPAGARDVVGPAVADDLTLTCGSHRAYVLVEGDKAAPSHLFTLGDPTATTPVSIAASALGRDEERDLFVWAEGDDVGVVRVAQSGAVTAADVHGGTVSPLHTEGARIPPEDDVVAIDADARTLALVTTHDESDACPDGRGGASVHALRIARQDAKKATSLLLSPSACARDVGPFWTNVLGASLVVAWTERASHAEKTAAPISGLAYRALEEGASLARIALSADALADAGCDATRCYAVALARDPGADGSKPESIRVVSYP
jgi:hypothetical protein